MGSKDSLTTTGKRNLEILLHAECYLGVKNNHNVRCTIADWLATALGTTDAAATKSWVQIPLPKQWVREVSAVWEWYSPKGSYARD